MDSTLVTRKDASNFEFYRYEPSMPAAIVFIVLFAMATLLHSWQMFRSRTWFMIPFVIGGIFETTGYVTRAISASESSDPTYSLGPYIIQSILILVAPALFAASIYMALGRIVLMVKGDDHLFIRRTWLTKIFVIGDILSFQVQSAGAGLLSSGDPSTVDAGNYIVIGGLFLQVIFFGLFVIAAVIFHVRMAKAPTQLAFDRPWQKHMIGLYIVSLLIFFRSIVRCVEYIQGNSGYIISHEIFLYVFDAALMFLAVASMNWIHPAEVKRYIRESKGGDESEDSSTVRMNEVAV